jgi:hypothetical protein
MWWLKNDLTEIERIRGEWENVRVIVKEHERKSNEALKLLSEDLALMKSQILKQWQDTKNESNASLLERIESMERRFASLHEMLVMKSPATGEAQLTKTGKMFRRTFRS